MAERRTPPEREDAPLDLLDPSLTKEPTAPSDPPASAPPDPSESDAAPAPGEVSDLADAASPDSPDLPAYAAPCRKNRRFSVRDMVKFALLAAILFVADIVLDLAPNIELVSMLVMVYTLVYRRRALIPIYLYVLLNAALYGFSPYNLSYFYIWLVLWGAAMLLPRRMPAPIGVTVCAAVSALFGLSFGALYAPGWMLVAKLNWEKIVAWWLAGLSFDVLHMIGNAAFGVLIWPLYLLLVRLERRSF